MNSGNPTAVTYSEVDGAARLNESVRLINLLEAVLKNEKPETTIVPGL